MTLMHRCERPEMPEKFRITAALYHQMFEMGAFEGKRVELLEGEIYEVSPMLDPHIACLARLTRELVLKLPPNAGIVSQVPIVLGENEGEPEPDFVVTRAPITGKAKAEDIALLLELSDSTLRRDRTVKVRLYARANIPEYWIINLNTDPHTLEVYREPDGDEYLERKVYKVGQDVAPLEFPEITIRWW